MKTIILKINKSKPEAGKLKQAAEVLKNGGVIVFPTDTVYGIAASAFDAKAREKIYNLKGRSFSKPLTLMVPDLNMLGLLAELPKKAKKITDKFWPGPLTLILPATHYGSIVMGGRKDLGLRIPADTVVAGILKYSNFPLATTSANPSGKNSAKTGREATDYFDGKVDLILDAGRCAHSTESTVIDMLNFPYIVVREGALPSKKLLEHI